MMKECCCCQRQTSDFYKVGTSANFSNALCKDCAAELGYNAITARLSFNLNILKKYSKLHPEAEDRYFSLLLKNGQEFLDNKEKNRIETEKRKGTRKKQTKCVCTSCTNVFYYGDYDEVKNVANVLHGSLYSLNQFKDLDQCPKCGSRAITKKEVSYWVDKNGNCIEAEE